MPPPNINRIKRPSLPGSLLDELKLKEDPNGRKRTKGPQDRKARRRAERDAKKQRPRGRPQRSTFADDNDDGFDDAGTPVEPAPKSILKKKPASESKSISKKPASEAKPNKKKRPAEDSEEEAPKRKKSKSKGEISIGLNSAVKEALAQDAAEIKFLEKKLKIKDSKKLPKSFQEDGLDFLLEGLEQDFLDDRKERAAMANKKMKKEARGEASSDEDEDEDMDGQESDGEGDEDEEDGLDDLMEDLDVDSQEEGDDERPDSEDEDEDEGPEDSDDEDGTGKDDEWHGISDSEFAAPNANPLIPAIPASASTAKYIPPSLRKAPTTESEQVVRLRRQVQGLLNRLSEANLLSILTEVENLYRTNPRGHVTDLISDLVLTMVCDPSALLDTFHILHAGFVAGIYKIIGPDFGAHVIQKLTTSFTTHHVDANLRFAGDQGATTVGKQCTNLMAFLSELYNFQVISCVLVFDYIRSFLSEITELHTELLLKLVRNSGKQLRCDDPSALKDLLAMMNASVEKIGEENLSIRTKFMRETLTDLKNNNVRATAASTVTVESTTRMKKILGSLNTRRLRATEPLRASLADIRNTDTKGKWWLVGASWAGNTPAATPKSTEADPDTDTDSDTAAPDLTTLARQHRMNTDIRRAIFTTLLSSSDYTDCHSRLSKLRLKRSQEPEIPRVLVHCAVVEGGFNPYYCLVAKRLCAEKRLRMGFKFVLWGYLARFGEEVGAQGEGEEEEDWGSLKGMRKVVNLGKLYAGLMLEGCLGWDILRTPEGLRWGFLKSATKSLLEVVVGTIVDAGESVVENVFWGVRAEEKAIGQELVAVVKGLKKEAKGSRKRRLEKALAVLEGGLREV